MPATSPDLCTDTRAEDAAASRGFAAEEVTMKASSTILWTGNGIVLESGTKTYYSGGQYPTVVIPAEAGIQKDTGCRIQSGMTELAI